MPRTTDAIMEEEKQPLIKRNKNMSDSISASTSSSVSETKEVEKPVVKRSTLSTTLISIAVVASVAGTWTAGTQFSQKTLTIDPKHYLAPYFGMWMSTCFMMLCYPVYMTYELARGNGVRQPFKDALTMYGPNPTPLRIFLYVMPFLLFWVGANYPYARALMIVAASVATAISSSNAAIVYVLSIFLLHDQIKINKVASVLIAIVGVTVMSIGLPTTSTSPIVGVILSVVSATSAAIYKVCFKRVFGSATLGQVSLFMSCLGFVNLFVNAIPTVILLWTKVEHIDWNYVPWGYMMGSNVLGLLFNFSINFGIALLHPLVVSVGMLMGIPLNTVIDVVFNHVHLTAFFLAGTGLICVSFFLIIFPFEILPFCRTKEKVAPVDDDELIAVQF